MPPVAETTPIIARLGAAAGMFCTPTHFPILARLIVPPFHKRSMP